MTVRILNKKRNQDDRMLQSERKIRKIGIEKKRNQDDRMLHSGRKIRKIGIEKKINQDDRMLHSGREIIKYRIEKKINQEQYKIRYIQNSRSYASGVNKKTKTKKQKSGTIQNQVHSEFE